jgi:Aerotolerance regulator N-terminal/von Willebrand factor type A domain
MSWLFPLYLAAAGAALAPILLHLRRQPPKDRVEFPTLMFLAASPQVVSTRRRIERWMLLLMRCLALILLAIMFARPFLADSAVTAGEGRAVLLLVDRSVSMSGAEMQAKVLARIEHWLGQLRSTDRVALASFDSAMVLHSPFPKGDSGIAALRAVRDEAITPTFAAGDLGSALVQASQALSQQAAVERRVVVISDFEEGSSLAALHSQTWPQGVSVVADAIAHDVTNLSASLVRSGESEQARNDFLRVRLAATPGDAAIDYQLRWDDSAIVAESGQLGQGTSRVLRLPRPSTQGHRLRLSGDKVTFDNELYLAPVEPTPLHVLLMAGQVAVDSADSPFFYLRHALQPTADLATQISIDSAQTAGKASWSPDWVVASNTVDATQAGELRTWLNEGGKMLVVATSTSSEFISALLARPVTLTEAKVADFALLGQVKLEHALLQPLRDPRLRDLSKIHHWHYRQWSAPGLACDVIARFDNGDPAWIVVPVGKGLVTVMLSGWQPKDSQLALSSRFVPLVYGHLAQVGVDLGQTNQRQVGEEGLASPGQHRLNDQRRVAVNLAQSESQTQVMDLGKLSSLGVQLVPDLNAAVSGESVGERLVNQDLESRQLGWLWALALLMWVLGVETWLSRQAAPALTAA